MSKPIRHPQLGNLSITRAKLLFVETMTVDPTLTLRELRAGIVIINSVDAAKGYGEPSLDFVARAIGTNDSAISKAVNIFDRKGYFRVDRGTYQHGGRGHANRYYPNWCKMQSAKPIADAATMRNTVSPDSLSPPASPEKHCQSDPLNTVSPDSTSLLTVSTVVNPAHISAPRPSGEGAHAHEPVGFQDLSDQEVMGVLEQIQRWLPSRPDHLTADELDDISLLHDECYSLWENRDIGDPIGGMAGRLADELGAPLPEEEAAAVGSPTDDVVVALDPWPTAQKKFGPWLAQRRHALGVQVRDLADALGIKASDLYDIEVRARGPRQRHAAQGRRLPEGSGGMTAGTCPNCNKPHPYLLPLHGDKGGPLFCPLCAGEWNARHTRRRKFGRVVIKAIQLYLANGGSFSDIRKMEAAVAMARLGFKDETTQFRPDDIGSEVGDITSELLADTIQLTHPDRHPPERREMAKRVTQELLALQPFVFPAPKPKPARPVTPPRNGSDGGRRETTPKPSQPAYPCELCAGSVPYFYCNPCKAEYRRRREAEREVREGEAPRAGEAPPRAQADDDQGDPLRRLR